MIRPGIRRVLRLPIRRRDLTDHDFDEEVRLHIELRAEQLQRQGMSAAAARAEAQRRFGPGEESRQALRSAAHRRDERLRSREWLFGILREIRSAGRTFRRQPLYAAGVIGTLGLGIGAAIVAFAIAWQAWLAPMPYPEPNRVIRLYELEPAGPETGTSEESRRQRLSPTLLGDIHARSWRTMEAVSLSHRPRQSDWIRDGRMQPVSGVLLSPEGFDILGIAPVLGRLPTDPERELLLTERFWRTHFGADPSAVGSEMNVGNGAQSVVGVVRLPSGYPGDVDIVRMQDWTWTEQDDREFRIYDAIARLRPGSSAEAAEAEMNAFLASLAKVHPVHRDWSMDAVVLSEDLVRPFRSVLAVLLAAGMIFLMLAIVNVTGIVAARSVERRRDRSIRLALGASEGRLLWGSISESLVLAIVGTITGIAGAVWLIGPIRSTIPHDVPRLADVAITPPLLIGGLAAGLILGLLVGVAGYLVSRRGKPSASRSPVWRTIGMGGRRTLVVGQVALTTLLTAANVAILHRVSTLRAIDLGYHPEGVSATSTVADERPYARTEFSSMVLEALEARGLSAAMAFNTPMSAEDVPRPGMRASPASEEVVYDLHLASPNYFSVMGIEMLAGRDFGPEDHASSERVVIVSEEFVDDYFGAGTPPNAVVGRVLAPLVYEETGPKVVGVVRSTRHRSPEAPVEPEIYSPLSQLALPPVTLLVRGEPDEVATTVSAALAQVDPELTWAPLVSYTSYLKEWLAPLRLQIVTTGLLGALGLVLACIGLYSFMAYQVVTGRKELGVRKALGASDGKLLWNVLARGGALTLLGVLLGLGVWYPLLPWTRELVDGIDSAGSLVPLAATLVIGASCVLATLVPAVRAARVDPAVTLRVD